MFRVAIVFVAVLCSPESCIIAATRAVRPSPTIEVTALKGLTQHQVDVYRQIVELVWERIEALSDRYPHLRTIKTATSRTDDTKHLWISYHYAQGVSASPNPAYVPGKKVAPTIKVFSPDDGIDLSLYFYEGLWPGQASVSPFSIGDMNVVVFIEGRETKALQSIRKAVMDSLRDEKERFEKETR